MFCCCMAQANLMEYIDQTWMKSSVWPIESWCVFKRTVRTNNDCEGWHLRLNNLAPGQSAHDIQVAAIYS